MILNKNKLLKDRYRFFNETTVIFQGSSLDILPRLKHSINQHNLGALRVLERDISDIKKEFNEIAFENKKLARHLIELHNSGNTDGGQKGVNSYTVKEKKEALEEKMKGAIESFEGISKVKERLEVILVICKRNKQQNMDYIRDLNYLVNNFKVCIRKEIEGIREKKREIQVMGKLTADMIRNFGLKVNNKEKTVNEIKKYLVNKMKFDEKYYKSKKLVFN